MSTETMVWMRIRPKAEELRGFQALAELMKGHSLTVEDERTAAILVYVESHGNEELFSDLTKLDQESTITMLGFGDSWSFENAETFIGLLVDHREQMMGNMFLGKDESRIHHLFDQLAAYGEHLHISDIVYRAEDFDVMGGFDEFVWCTHDGCNVPAEYNMKRQKNGEPKGRDAFPASKGISEDDLPYCQQHFEQAVKPSI